MRLRLSPVLGAQVHHLIVAQSDADENDPAREQGERARLALHANRQEWIFESDDPVAIAVLRSHLHWTAETADDVPSTVRAAARRAMKKIDHEKI